MNRYSWPLNALVVLIVLLGIIVAAPNYYGTAPAVQVSTESGEPVSENQLTDWQAQLIEGAEITPDAAYIDDDGRAVFRYANQDEQFKAHSFLKSVLDSRTPVVFTQASLSPAWIQQLGLKPMSLGLDLRGGVHFLFEVDLEEAVNTRLTLFVQAIEDNLREAGISRRVEKEGASLRVRLREASDLDAARTSIRRMDSDLDITDGQDGRSLIVRMTEAQIAEREEFAIQQNIITLRNRVNELGVAEPLVQRKGKARIVVQLPGVQDPAAADRIISSTATLEFRMEEEGSVPASRRFKLRDGGTAGLKRQVIASGDQIVDASSTFSEGRPAVSVRLDAVGGSRMLKNTQENVGKRMGVLFIETKRRTVLEDGVKVERPYQEREIISLATIQGVFKSNFIITGLTAGEAADLALLLRAGALAAPISKVEERTIGPTLGQENIDRGFAAVKFGFIAVVIFMMIYYRVFGIVATAALLTNLVLIVAALSIFQASLTLPGIAGIVLTVGMAVDANVLIYERIREELKAGSSPQLAIHAGYEKAFSSIADANVTTLIAAFVLFAFGTGPIKGFAVTLLMGIITSMFTAIIGTRAVVNALFGNRQLKDLPV